MADYHRRERTGTLRYSQYSLKLKPAGCEGYSSLFHVQIEAGPVLPAR